MKFLMGPGWAKNLKFLMGPGWAKKSEIRKIKGGKSEIFYGSGVGRVRGGQKMVGVDKKFEIFDGSGVEN